MSTGLLGPRSDPADRIILATALQLGSALMTADQALLEWNGKLKRHDARG